MRLILNEPIRVRLIHGQARLMSVLTEPRWYRNAGTSRSARGREMGG